jgi:hypothetical protein
MTNRTELAFPTDDDALRALLIAAAESTARDYLAMIAHTSDDALDYTFAYCRILTHLTDAIYFNDFTIDSLTDAFAAHLADDDFTDDLTFILDTDHPLAPYFRSEYDD